MLVQLNSHGIILINVGSPGHNIRVFSKTHGRVCMKQSEGGGGGRLHPADVATANATWKFSQSLFHLSRAR